MSGNLAKNIVKNAGNVIAAIFLMKVVKTMSDRVEKDEYIRAMIQEARLDDYLDKIKDPKDMYIVMLYIEVKLDSYGKNNYKLYSKYFGGYFGLDDYTDNYGITLIDKISKNVKNKKKKKEEARKKLEQVAKKLKEDFQKDIK